MMGPSSKNGEKNTAGVGGIIHQGHDDLGCYDERLARRFKRRRLVESLNLDASTEDNVNEKKTVEGGGDGDDFFDPEYRRFLSGLGHYGSGNVYNVSDSEDNALERQDNGADYSDPDYKIFLERLRVDGNSYALELPLSGEMSLLIKYEKEVGSSNGHQLRNLDALQHLLGGVNMKGDKTLRGLLKRDRMEHNLSDIRRTVMEDNLRDIRRTEMEDNLKDSRRTETEDNLRDFRRTERKSPLNMRNNKKEAGNLHKQPTHEDDHMVDESYLIYLNSLKKGVDPPIVKQEIDTEVKIEDDGNSSDSEVIIMSEDPFIHGNRTPFVTSKFKDAPIDVDSDIGHRRQGKGDHSQFREKLMDLLTKPFDQKEYEHLHKEIYANRSKEGCRRLRGKEIAYALGSCTPSYIDLHDDLKMKIDSYKTNPQKVLILLRGFFFWLENITQGGAFPPWQDPSCSELLSQP